MAFSKRYWELILCAIIVTNIFPSLLWGQIQYTRVTQKTSYTNNFGPSNYAVNAFVNIYKDIKLQKLEEEKAKARLEIIKTNYESYATYPDTIADGWHNVVVTDNVRFCGDAKVLVSNNRIKEFVINDYLYLTFNATGTIKNARNTVMLNKPDGNQLEIVDVYFLYDLEETVLTSPPIHSGYISFYTLNQKYIQKDIVIGGIHYDGVPAMFSYKKGVRDDLYNDSNPVVLPSKNAVPECGQNGTSTLQFKPGRYTFQALASGRDLLGSFEIRADECLMFRLE